MGSEFMTLEETSNRLGRSKRSIQYYLSHGYLKRQLKNGQVLIDREDVEQLALELGSDMPALNRKTFFQLMNRVRKIEEDNSIYRRMWDIKDNPLRPSNEEALALYNAATRSASCSEWKTEEMETWAGMFDRMDEVFLETLIQASILAKPWVVFYQLCISMMKYVSELNKKQPDLSLQVLHKKLDEGRKRMRGTILMWIEMGRGTVPETLIRQLDSDQDDLMRRLVLVKSK